MSNETKPITVEQAIRNFNQSADGTYSFEAMRSVITAVRAAERAAASKRLRELVDSVGAYESDDFLIALEHLAAELEKQ